MRIGVLLSLWVFGYTTGHELLAAFEQTDPVSYVRRIQNFSSRCDVSRLNVTRLRRDSDG